MAASLSLFKGTHLIGARASPPPARRASCDPTLLARSALKVPAAPLRPQAGTAVGMPALFSWWSSSLLGVPYARGSNVETFHSRGCAPFERWQTVAPSLLPSLDCKPLLSSVCCAPAGVGEAAIARDPLVRHDIRTVRKVLGRSVRWHAGHGGTRRDHLGDEGRQLLYRAVQLYDGSSPTDKWLARLMTLALGKKIGQGVVRRACKHMGLSRHGVTVLYSECDPSPPPFCFYRVSGLARPLATQPSFLPATDVPSHPPSLRAGAPPRSSPCSSAPS